MYAKCSLVAVERVAAPVVVQENTSNDRNVSDSHLQFGMRRLSHSLSVLAVVCAQ